MITKQDLINIGFTFVKEYKLINEPPDRSFRVEVFHNGYIKVELDYCLLTGVQVADEITIKEIVGLENMNALRLKNLTKYLSA